MSTEPGAGELPASGATSGSVASRLARLGRSLVLLRMLRGLSQDELARRAGIRPNQVSRYETGQVLPQMLQLAKLLTALGIDEVDFFLFHAQVVELDATTATLERAEEAREVKAVLRQLVARRLRLFRQVREGVESLLVTWSGDDRNPE